MREETAMLQPEVFVASRQGNTMVPGFPSYQCRDNRLYPFVLSISGGPTTLIKSKNLGYLILGICFHG